MNGICIPCAWKNGVSDYKQKKLLSDAKNRAIENEKYVAIFFDEEDKDFEVLQLEEAKQRGIEFIKDIISPYSRIAT